MDDYSIDDNPDDWDEERWSMDGTSYNIDVSRRGQQEGEEGFETEEQTDRELKKEEYDVEDDLSNEDK